MASEVEKYLDKQLEMAKPKANASEKEQLLKIATSNTYTLVEQMKAHLLLRLVMYHEIGALTGQVPKGEAEEIADLRREIDLAIKTRDYRAE